jgi:hypothetical protein
MYIENLNGMCGVGSISKGILFSVPREHGRRWVLWQRGGMYIEKMKWDVRCGMAREGVTSGAAGALPRSRRARSDAPYIASVEPPLDSRTSTSQIKAKQNETN